MATVDEIKALVASMPELDNPPPPPEKKADQTKPAEGAKPADGSKPVETPKPAKPQAAAEAPKPKLEKGKLTGPAWADAVKVYDAILSGGAEAVGAVLDMVRG